MLTSPVLVAPFGRGFVDQGETVPKLSPMEAELMPDYSEARNESPDLSEFDYERRIGEAGYLRSSARESMLEHVFVSELLQESWFSREQTIEVLHSEVDAYGYNLVLRSNRVTRWVQLKTSSGARKPQAVSRLLLNLPGACVILLRFTAHDNRLQLKYDVYGGTPSESLADPGNGSGIHTITKKQRPSTVLIRASQFAAINNVGSLLEWLFGPAPAIEPLGPQL